MLDRKETGADSHQSSRDGVFPAERTERKGAVSPGSSDGGGGTENGRGRRDLTVTVRDAVGVMWMAWQGMAGSGTCTRKTKNW